MFLNSSSKIVLLYFRTPFYKRKSYSIDMVNSTANYILRYAIYFPAGLSLILGAIVLFGWHTHDATLMLVKPAFASGKITTTERKRVFVLNSYHPGYFWSDNVMKGVQSVIDPEGDTDLVIEYLDTKRHFSKGYLEEFAGLMKKKYQDEHFDILISTDDNALDFMLRYRDELFPGSTLVFSGINKLDPRRTDGYSNVYGFTENLRVKDTLDVAVDLQPEAKDVYFIADQTKSSAVMLDKARAAKESYKNRLAFHYLVGLPPDELATRLHGIKKDAIVIYLVYIRIGEGQTISLKQSIALVTSNSPAPVYVTWGFRAGHGIVGGRTVSGFLQGEVAAKLATQIMQTGSTEGIPVWQVAPHKDVFDYESMIKHGLKTKNLPDGAQLFNQPESIYSTNPTLVWGFFIFTLMLIAVVLVLVNNIRNRKQSEEKIRHLNTELENRVVQRTRKLAESEQLMHAVLDHSPAVIYLKDLQGRYLIVNRIWSEVTGISAERAIGATDFDVLPADVAEEFSANDRQVIKNSSPVQNEEYLPQADGKTHTYRSFKFPVSDPAGEIFALGGVSTDITDLVTMQKELEQARVIAEDASSAKSDFLANMSHEIRTPMNAIIGMSYLALQTDLDRKQRNYIEKVHRSGESLLGIINDILDFSKIEAGKLDVESINFWLEDVFDNLSNLVGLAAEEKGLELMFNLHADLPTVLIGDPLRLGQVLVNLGNNAVKFTAAGGEVTISVTVSEESADTITLQFSIRDSGIGMTPDQQKILFQSFSQADTSTSRKYGGTGLGLAICKNLTELMGGKIWLESEVGKGTTFHFTARFGKQQGEIPQPRTKASVLGALHILVVDDNSTARDILTSILTSFGLRVDQANSGDAAKTILEQTDEDDPYELVLMDWKMPGMDGLEVARAIQNDKTLSEIPTVIMVTAYGREEAQQAASDVEVSGFLTKPVTPSSLLDAIMVAMGRDAISDSRADNRQLESSATISKLRGAKILLVEDNEINQELALELLQNNGLEVMVANDGVEALTLLKATNFDGVLMDCQMPIMDGYEATRKIRQQEQYKDLPVIAMTANAMAGDKEKVLEAGMNDHIAKPINVNDMFNTMAKWITPANPQLISTVEVEPADKEERFPELTGINVSAGLAITQGNTALYRKLLVKFRENYADFSTALRDILESDDAEALTRLAHTLKGVAGNIGATQIQEAAGALEQASIRGQSDYEELLQHVIDVLEPVITNLAVLDNAVTAKVSDRKLDIEQVNGLLTRLRELLEDNDAEATEIIDELEELPTPAVDPALLKQLAKTVSEYDFDEALIVLAALEASRGSND